MLTLEERERLAYITHSPDHALVMLALEADEEVCAERDDYKEQAEESDDQVSELRGKVEDLEAEVEELRGKVEDLEAEVEELKDQIHEAGIDLV